MPTTKFQRKHVHVRSSTLCGWWQHLIFRHCLITLVNFKRIRIVYTMRLPAAAVGSIWLSYLSFFMSATVLVSVHVKLICIDTRQILKHASARTPSTTTSWWKGVLHSTPTSYSTKFPRYTERTPSTKPLRAIICIMPVYSINNACLGRMLLGRPESACQPHAKCLHLYACI